MLADTTHDHTSDEHYHHRKHGRNPLRCHTRETREWLTLAHGPCSHTEVFEHEGDRIIDEALRTRQWLDYLTSYKCWSFGDRVLH